MCCGVCCCCLGFSGFVLGFLVGSSDCVKFLPFYLLGLDICTHGRIILYQ